MTRLAICCLETSATTGSASAWQSLPAHVSHLPFLQRDGSVVKSKTSWHFILNIWPANRFQHYGKDPDCSRLKSDFSKNSAKKKFVSHALFHLPVLNASCGCWVFGDWQLEMGPLPDLMNNWYGFISSPPLVAMALVDLTRRRKDAENGWHQGPGECQQCARFIVVFAPLNPQASSPAKQ